MSMNLHCNKIPLWQTPTYITYMCMECESHKARLKAYLHWAKSTIPSVARNDKEVEEMQGMKEIFEEHRKRIHSVMNDADLEVTCW